MASVEEAEISREQMIEAKRLVSDALRFGIEYSEIFRANLFTMAFGGALNESTTVTDVLVFRERLQ